MHPDLKDYLEKMICPPDGQILITSDLYSVPFGELEDCSYHGAIIVGEPTERQVEELLRILTPGAHIMIMGTEQSPTAFEGVCISEDAGFEVRDAIFVADDPERFKYASKASRKEREAGCAALPARKGHEAVEREEGSAGVANPRAGAGRTANEVRNFHPTVKSVEIMDWCMREVSPGDHVVEPFGGSGTTACVAPGRRVNLTAIELNEEGDYGAIIDARVRHWANNVHFVPGGVKITSEFESEVEVDDGPTDFFSLLTQDVQPRMEIMNREGEIEIILLEGDCVERMQEIPANSVDWVITDPPYGLKFMNKGFDNLGEGSQQREWHRRWLEQAFRILKPGCQIKAFCGTRTQHHLLKAMSEVGFEGVGADTVDSEAWIYGSGFPKSLNVSKEIDRILGEEREIVGTYDPRSKFDGKERSSKAISERWRQYEGRNDEDDRMDWSSAPITAPASDEAKKWEGWGTALKPAWEPICCGRKPE